MKKTLITFTLLYNFGYSATGFTSQSADVVDAATERADAVRTPLSPVHPNIPRSASFGKIPHPKMAKALAIVTGNEETDDLPKQLVDGLRVARIKEFQNALAERRVGLGDFSAAQQKAAVDHLMIEGFEEAVRRGKIKFKDLTPEVQETLKKLGDKKYDPEEGFWFRTLSGNFSQLGSYCREGLDLAEELKRITMSQGEGKQRSGDTAVGRGDGGDGL